MSYTPFNWQARTGQGLNKFTDQITGQVFELESTPDSVTSEGTPFSTTRMNALEQGLANVFNKPEQLTAAVAALFGLSSSAVPNDVLEILGETRVQIATGSYTGTGQYGSSSPNSLTFSFRPKVFVLYKESTETASGQLGNAFVWINVPILTSEYTQLYLNGAVGSGFQTYVSFSDANVMKWYATRDDYQFNISNRKYTYWAWG